MKMRGMSLKKRTVLTLFALFLSVNPVGMREALASSGQEEGIQLMAHRGDGMNHPENTLPAFQSSIDSGVQWIELDVTQTKDGVLVVYHDEDLRRITGQEKKIWEVTYEELKTFSVEESMGPAYSNVRIPTLEQVMDLCSGKVKLNIEVKENGHESPDFIDRIVALIGQKQMQGQCMITSFGYDVLTKVKSLDASLATGYILSRQPEQFETYTAADSFMLSIDLIRPELVKQLHSLGKQVSVWTVNDPCSVKKCLEAGADSLITDKPDYVREALTLFIS